MSAKILDGKALAETIRAEIKEDVAKFIAETGVQPTLAVVLVGEDPASQVYVRNKELACEKAGLRSVLRRLPASTTTEELETLVAQLNGDPNVHGVLVQLPLPKHIDEKRILDLISPEKDVDAFHPENVGLISQGRPRFLPCTPYGIQQLLVRYGIETTGKRAVVVGRSDIVGKPMAHMLLMRNATVTICHSKTPIIAEFTRNADIVVAATGKIKITGDMLKPGSVFIDVGMQRDENGKLCGDGDFASCSAVAGFITPTPGGTGPMTIAGLMMNTVDLA